MASFTRGTVLECAIEPCTNPAEIEVSIVGYGEYPPMVVRLCPPCANTFGKLLHDWPLPPAGEMDIRAGSLASKREQKGIFQGVSTWGPDNASPDLRESLDALATLMPERDTEDTSERYPTRSPYVTTGRVKAGKNPYPWTFPPDYGSEEYHSSTYFSDALDEVSEEVIDAMKEALRRIEVHPASNPVAEPEQYKPGWLPGDA